MTFVFKVIAIVLVVGLYSMWAMIAIAHIFYKLKNSQND